MTSTASIQPVHQVPPRQALARPRPPPQDVEAERAVLGAIMVDPPSITRVSGLLEADDFFAHANRLFWVAMLDLHTRGMPIDEITLAALMEEAHSLEIVGGRAAIAGLRAEIGTSAAIVSHAMIVRDAADKRRLLDGQTPRPKKIPAGDFAVEHTYGLTSLDLEEKRELVPVADLPQAHGWGAEVQAMLCGGLGAGDVFVLGAGKAGAGKTALVLQLADGLAMRSAQLAGDPALDPAQALTPVVILTELKTDDVAHRSIARLCKFPYSILRSAPAAIRHYGRVLRDEKRAEMLVHNAYAQARDEVTSGAFSTMRPWIHVARPAPTAEMLDGLRAHIEEWVTRIKRAHPAREVVPVVVVDPIQRMQQAGMSEVEALNVLSEKLDVYADECGWCVLMTSDTNKETAKGAAQGAKSADADDAAGIFRGSYKLNHSSEITAVLTSDDPVLQKVPRGVRFKRAAVEPWQERPRAITLTITKNRNGPSWGEASFMYRPACGLFEAECPEETDERRRSDIGTAEQQEAAARSGQVIEAPKNERAEDVEQRVLRVLADAALHGNAPVPVRTLRDLVGGKHEAVDAAIESLSKSGAIVQRFNGKRPLGWDLADDGPEEMTQ